MSEKKRVTVILDDDLLDWVEASIHGSSVSKSGFIVDQLRTAKNGGRQAGPDELARLVKLMAETKREAQRAQALVAEIIVTMLRARDLDPPEAISRLRHLIDRIAAGDGGWPV